MSTGSEFRFLKSIPECMATQAEIDALREQEEANTASLFAEGHKPNTSKFLLKGKVWIDTTSTQKYTEMFTVSFNSMFSELRDEYNLDPYSRNQLEITQTGAKEMCRALKYLKLGTYNPDTEDIIDSKYISVFDILFPKYLASKHKDKSYLESMDEYRMIGDRILQVMETFIMICDEMEYEEENPVLLYTVW